ncbi:uncharacterized protein BDZ99DRAFT_270231 [Mytilinidion resinicola]|uniref:Uncharacterized protein n=1 Tax=Mytilinidion resinicola TaxID=574789 RepID=A0A6A6YXJ2_9PEZI|nr:uncharacterized protein BDZ99DRAFT_270231 [Mytilinidion resinicola]KAF2812625.1 hypothetical protein BDZ99DRAFT_270231 [Mytilinidion resinicola]
MATAQRAVSSRISRYHYGFCWVDTFNPDIHTIQELVYDRAEGTNLAVGQMKWVVKRGDTIGHLRPVVVPCQNKFRYEAEIANRRIYVDIWHSGFDPAPRRQTHDVHKLCTIVCHLPRSLRFGDLPEYIGEDLVPYRRLEIDIAMSPRGSDLYFAIYFNGDLLPTEYQWPNRDFAQGGISIETE